MAPPYLVRVKASTERELRGIPRNDLKRIDRRIRALAHEPRPPGCEKLAGEAAYRLRQGDFRIIYTVDDENRVVEVVKIGPRREVYR